MSKQLASEMSRAPNQSSPKHHHWTFPQFYLRLSLVLLAACATLFILSQIQFLQPPPLDNSHPTHAFSFVKYQWLNTMKKFERCSEDARLTAEKLRRAVTFLPLKDLRYMQSALQGHTWFLSSMYDTQEEGEVQFQHFPSESSNGRLLCLKGRDNHDGSWNSYALAYPETLPYNATMMDGLTFVSYNHYNYDNIWHGLSAMVPFVAWHIKNGCSALPNRWVLYHWGELRSKMGPWLTSLMDATFDGSIDIERFEDREDDHPSCFEEAVVMRHNEGGMSRDKRLEVYDLMRCKARTYCHVTRVAEVNNQGTPLIGLTMFMRTGPRSFRNQSAVVEIFNRECKKVAGCQLTTAHSNNLTFCEQVKLMSMTDILVSPHGAQLTNMFLMDRNSSVMEFFPKGWLKLAGVGQYVHHWIASWSGMRHQGTYRDPNGEPCPYGEDDRRCMTIYKSGLIGHNETYFGEWARNVLNEVKISKTEGANKRLDDSVRGCACH